MRQHHVWVQRIKSNLIFPLVLEHPIIDPVQVPAHVLSGELGLWFPVGSLPIINDESNVRSAHNHLPKKIQAMIYVTHQWAEPRQSMLQLESNSPM